MLKKMVIIVAMVVMMVTGMGMTVEAAEKNNVYDNIEIINATNRMFLEMYIDSTAARKMLSLEPGNYTTIPFLRYEKDEWIIDGATVELRRDGTYMLYDQDGMYEFIYIDSLMRYIKQARG